MKSQRTRPPSNGRAVAARVLARVLSDSAFAAAALDAELRFSPELDPRERALATELVYGVLRRRAALEERLNRVAERGIKDPTTRVHLLIAAYQLLVLRKIPAFAAVDQAVIAVKALRGQRMAGFTNAVLRKLAVENQPLESQGVAEAPEWLVERLSNSVGPKETLLLLGAGRRHHPVLRIVRGRALPEWLERAEPGRRSPSARYVERSGDPRAMPGYQEGAFVVQEEGSQAIALLVGARPGDRVLDACAGRGQKASLLAEQIGPIGALWTTDRLQTKLDALRKEFQRLALPPPTTSVVDWTVGTENVPANFDRVLVDAPCSGTGTLARRPEILLRLGPSDPGRLADLSASILRSAATRALPGGRILFSVCSVLPEEGEGVVARVLDLLEPCPFEPDALASVGLAESLGTRATELRLLPGRDGTDGYFVASLRRRR